MTIRDRFALELLKTLVTKYKAEDEGDLVDKAVDLADKLALRLALGDPVEQRLLGREADPAELTPVPTKGQKP